MMFKNIKPLDPKALDGKVVKLHYSSDGNHFVLVGQDIDDKTMFVFMAGEVHESDV